MNPRPSRAAMTAGVALTLTACASLRSAPHAAPPTARRDTPASTPSAPLAPVAARQATALALSPSETSLLIADADDGTLTALDADTLAPRGALQVAVRPVAVLALRDGRALVLDQARDELIAVRLGADARPTSVLARVRVAPDPVGLTVSADERTVFVVSGAAAELSVLDAASLAARASVPLAREPRAVAISPDGATAYVAHVTDGVLGVVDLRENHERTLALPLGPLPAGGLEWGATDPEHRPPTAFVRRTHASLARALALSPDGAHLYVAYTVEARLDDRPNPPSPPYYGAGDESDGSKPLTTVAVFDTARGEFNRREIVPRNEFGALSTPLPTPAAMVYRATDRRLVLTSYGAATFGVLDPARTDPALGAAVAAVTDCDGPTGLAVNRAGRTFVWCQFRHVVHAVAPGRAAPEISRAVGDAVPEPVLDLGRLAFYRADGTVSSAGFTCDTCHPDGRDDGAVWQTVNGMRQTPFLAARLHDTAPYAWEGDRADLRPYIERTVSRLGGAGMTPQSLAALEAYVRHGLHAPESTRRRIAALEGARLAQGHALFDRAGCAGCHAAGALTDHRTHDVLSEPGDGHRASLAPQEIASTLEAIGPLARGRRGARRDFDTPSLHLVALTPPYFHDGRYATLEQMLADNRDRMGHTMRLTPDQTAALLAYVRSL